MVKGIGLELKGWYEPNGTYHMTEKEINLEKEGKITVVGTTTYHFSPKGSYKEHNYDVLNMDIVESIDIFYDIEDDGKMSQTFHLKNGSTIFGMSRNDTEVSIWEKNGIPITKSYGY